MIWSYNSKAEYKLIKSQTKKIEFSLLDIYINNSQHIPIQLKDVFKAYPIIPETDSWVLKPKKLSFYRCQLNFAIYCATTALGISEQHLTHAKNLVRSVYNFHVYYHVRKILNKLEVALPDEKDFAKFINRYSKEVYHNICEDYGVDSTLSWIRGDWYYTPSGGIFRENEKGVIEKAVQVGFAPSSNYCEWIIARGSGFTKRGIQKVSETVMAYVYLVLNSQANARSTLIGNSGKALEAQLIFEKSLERLISSAISPSKEVANFENVLKFARSKVDFSVGEGLYMLPSDMNLHSGTISGWNNKILVSKRGFQLGINGAVNVTQHHHQHRLEHRHQDRLEHRLEHRHQKAASSALEHEEEKEAVLLSIAVAILAFVYFLK